MTDYAYILTQSYPGKKWDMNGDDYEGIVWKDESPMPSKEELDQAYLDYKAANDYKKHRAAEYPRIEDQLDMLYHDAKNGTTTWVDSLDAVKTKYPKPE